jgi:methionine aminopeptidase
MRDYKENPLRLEDDFDVGNKAVGIMKPGQTFTIEPMINAGKST